MDRKIMKEIYNLISRLDMPECRKRLIEQLSCEYLGRNADSQIKRVNRAIETTLGLPDGAAEEDEIVKDCLLDLALAISTRDDRLIASRQASIFPCELNGSEHVDPTLDGNGMYLAGVVHVILGWLSQRLDELSARKRETKQKTQPETDLQGTFEDPLA